MLRGLIALLLLGNLAFFAWTQGWLDPVLGPARAEREPQRVAAQVRPEQVQILRSAAAPGAAASSAARPASGPASGPPAAPAPIASAVAGASAPGNGKAVAPATSGPAPAPMAAASRVPAVATASAPGPVATTRPTPTPAAAPAPSPAPGPAPVPPRPVASAPATAAAPTVAAPSAPAASRPAPAVASVCLEAGPFGAAELAAAEADMRSALPGGGWGARQAELNGEWMIYMGPYPDRETIDRKKAELGRIRGGITHEEISAPSPLAGGLSLGRFASPGAANTTLAQYRLRGIRTARVVQSAAGTPVTYLRVAQAEAATAARLAELKLGPSGRAFSGCPR